MRIGAREVLFNPHENVVSAFKMRDHSHSKVEVFARHSHFDPAILGQTSVVLVDASHLAEALGEGGHKHFWQLSHDHQLSLNAVVNQNLLVHCLDVNGGGPFSNAVGENLIA